MNPNPGKKIAYFANSSWNLFNFRVGLMRTMRQKGFEVIACAPRSRYSDKLALEGIRFIELPLDPAGTNFFKDAALLLRIWKICKREQPRLVHNFGVKAVIYGTIASRFAPVSSIFNTLTGLGHGFLGKKLVFHILKLLFRYALRPPVKVSFQNQDHLNFFIQQKIVLEEQTVLIPGSGVDTEKFVPRRDETSQKGGRGPVFLMMARPLWAKGLREYFEAVHLFQERAGRGTARFIYLGGSRPGTYDKRSKNYIQRPYDVPPAWIERETSANGIEWVSHQEEVLPYLKEADIVVLPSYSEGMPRSLLEAMSCAKPVIATDVPGCRQAVEHGKNGLLVAPRDADTLARAMEYFTQHSDEIRRMGLAGRERVLEHFSDDRILRRTLEEYRKLGIDVS